MLQNVQNKYTNFISHRYPSIELNLRDFQSHRALHIFTIFLERAAERAARGAQLVEEVETGHGLPLFLAVARVKVGSSDYRGSARRRSGSHHRQFWPDRVGWKTLSSYRRLCDWRAGSRCRHLNPNIVQFAQLSESMFTDITG